VEGSMLNKTTHRKFFTGDLWTLVNRCYKAICFDVHSSMTIF